VVVRNYAPPSVIINDNREVLHATGDVSRYLKYSAGAPSRNILEMVVSELRQPLRSLLYRAKKEDQEFPISTRAQINTEKEQQFTAILVDELTKKDFQDDLLLVVFKKISDITPVDDGREVERLNDSGEDGKIIEELENELAQTKEQLQIT